MNYPLYLKKGSEHSMGSSLKAQENKPHTINVKKGYEEDQETYVVKSTDSVEVKAMKQKMKIVMQKLSVARKQKQQAHKENQQLEKQIITLRNNVRHMIPGFNNTSSNFPMQNEIIASLMEFYKYECLDRFFENLCPEELSMKGVIYFYHFSFSQVIGILDQYFKETYQSVKTTGCFETLEGPIMNVLRKSFQTTFDKILAKMTETQQLRGISWTLIEKLCLESQEREVLEQTLTAFLLKLLQLCLCCRISDPPLHVETDSIGKRIKYNSIFNDPLDGFIKNKDQCWVVLPEIRKSQNQQIVVKSLVLKTDYFDQDDEDLEGDE